MPAAAENRYGRTRNASHHQTQGPHPAPFFAFITLITHLPPPDSSYFVAYDEEGEQATYLDKRGSKQAHCGMAEDYESACLGEQLLRCYKALQTTHKPL
jgi:hypothetical protein